MAWTDWAGAGGVALGLGGDIYAHLENQKIRRQAEQINELLTNPAKMAEYVRQVYQPMSDAQAKAVHRDLGANWSVMTGGAPGGAMNQYVTDALAKIESQRYNEAASRALQSVGYAAGAGGKTLPMGNTASVLQALMTLKRMGGEGANRTPGPLAVANAAPGLVANGNNFGRSFDNWFGSGAASPDTDLMMTR